MARSICFFAIVLSSCYLGAQPVTLSGVVRTAQNEFLPSARVSVLPDSLHTVTGDDGAFRLKVHRGHKTLLISFVGFEEKRIAISISNDTTVQIILSEKVSQLGAVTVEATSDPQQEIFTSNQTSTNVLDKNDITSIPVLGGEADVIKALLLLPGTVRGIEGSSDLFVRGGAADQNLVLLDGAPVYNTSHLFGFLSVFNPDILHKVESVNGGFPARFGGRLSSVLNVETVRDIPERTHVSGDIGLIASRMMIEQPVGKKAGFWVAGRRTYIDHVVKAVGEELPYFFFDLNTKVIIKPSASDLVEIAYFQGEDLLDLFRDRNNDGDGYLTTYESGNNTQSITWRKKLPRNTRSELALIRTGYRYDIRNIFEENQLLASSDIEDYSAKLSLFRDSVGNGTVSAGTEWIRHQISPNVISTSGFFSELLKTRSTTGMNAYEGAVFSDYTWSPVDRVNVTAGLRSSMAIVPGKKYFVQEPRFAARYELADNQALKISYSRMAQYLHRISNSAVTTPTDIWYPVTSTIKPQTSHQIAAGWQRIERDQHLFFGVEGYYKTMEQLIGYREGTNLFFNTEFESKLIQGKGVAYGFEFLVRKDAGKISGWISYTLSWSRRQFDGIANGDWFPSRYDRRHNGAIVAQYSFTKRWSASAVWEFISGSRFTPIVGQYVVFAPTLTGVDMIPVYTPVNSVKLADTHRLDLGIKYRNKPGRKFQWHWFAGVYNTYNRASPVGMAITQDETDGSLRYEQPGLFGLLPFISYGFKF